MPLRRAALALGTTCTALAAGTATAHADVGYWDLHQSPVTQRCGTTVVASYYNGTASPVQWKHTVTASAKVTISASITGGGGEDQIAAQLGVSVEGSVTVSNEITATVNPTSTLNVTVMYSDSSWTLYHHGLSIDSSGTGYSSIPVGLCLYGKSGAPAPPPPPP